MFDSLLLRQRIGLVLFAVYLLALIATAVSMLSLDFDQWMASSSILALAALAMKNLRAMCLQKSTWKVFVFCLWAAALQCSVLFVFDVKFSGLLSPQNIVAYVTVFLLLIVVLCKPQAKS